MYVFGGGGDTKEEVAWAHRKWGDLWNCSQLELLISVCDGLKGNMLVRVMRNQVSQCQQQILNLKGEFCKMTIKLQIHFQADGMLSIFLLISVSFKGLLPVNF